MIPLHGIDDGSVPSWPTIGTVYREKCNAKSLINNLPYSVDSELETSNFDGRVRFPDGVLDN